MDPTEHLICTGGAELDGRHARGLPTRPHRPSMGDFHPFQWLLPTRPPHRWQQSGDAGPGGREEKGVCCRPDPLQLPAFSHLVLPTPLGDGDYYHCPLRLSSAARRREARGHHQSAPGFEPPAAARPPCEVSDLLPGQRSALCSDRRRGGVQGWVEGGGGGAGEGRAQRRAGRRHAEAERWNTASIRPVTPACRRSRRVTKTAEQKIAVPFAVRPARRPAGSCPRQAPVRCVINDNTTRRRAVYKLDYTQRPARPSPATRTGTRAAILSGRHPPGVRAPSGPGTPGPASAPAACLVFTGSLR